MINFSTTKQESQLIDAIVSCVTTYFDERDIALDKLSLTMDITATHLNGCPLDLERMLLAEDGDLMHDIAGITLDLNWNNGILTSHFLLRFAA